MAEHIMEDYIGEVLTGDARKNALDFVAYLRASGMCFERGSGYWEDKLYWIITYRDESVCYILINDNGEDTDPWVIWSDDSESDWFADFPPDEHTKEIAWRNVDKCANCGCGCSPGTSKKIFGKEFANVCRTTFRFNDPNADELDCLKKMLDIRKCDILKNP